MGCKYMYGDHIWILLTFSEFGCNCYVNATRMPVMPENAYELCGVAKLDVKIIVLSSEDLGSSERFQAKG